MIKFSSIVSDLTFMWLEWMQQNKLATNPYLDNVIREKAADRCEELIALEYTLTTQLDKFYDI